MCYSQRPEFSNTQVYSIRRKFHDIRVMNRTALKSKEVLLKYKYSSTACTHTAILNLVVASTKFPISAGGYGLII